ncbi:Aminotransferase class-III [Variovorax sp. CF079]|nr:Aminotransferase class-III [Variovorax sp. CF079]
MAVPHLHAVGEVAVEMEQVDAAVRFIVQYYNAIGKPTKKQVIALERGYHGSSSTGAGLTAVLQAHGVQEGPIFRRIRKGGHLGEPLAPAAVRDIVKERCALAGIEGRFSAHSLRAGFVTEAGKQNMPLPETMAMTGHQSVATVVGYFRAESALGSKVSRMLDEDERPAKP